MPLNNNSAFKHNMICHDHDYLIMRKLRASLAIDGPLRCGLRRQLQGGADVGKDGRRRIVQAGRIDGPDARLHTGSAFSYYTPHESSYNELCKGFNAM